MVRLSTVRTPNSPFMGLGPGDDNLIEAPGFVCIPVQCAQQNNYFKYIKLFEQKKKYTKRIVAHNKLKYQNQILNMQNLQNKFNDFLSFNYYSILDDMPKEAILILQIKRTITNTQISKVQNNNNLHRYFLNNIITSKK